MSEAERAATMTDAEMVVVLRKMLIRDVGRYERERDEARAALARVEAERDGLRAFLQAVRAHGYDAAVEVLGEPDAPAAP